MFLMSKVNFELESFSIEIVQLFTALRCVCQKFVLTFQANTINLPESEVSVYSMSNNMEGTGNRVFTKWKNH